MVSLSLVENVPSNQPSLLCRHPANVHLESGIITHVDTPSPQLFSLWTSIPGIFHINLRMLVAQGFEYF